MWNVTNRYKNSYLQSKINIMNPALLNQCVETAMNNPNSILCKRQILKSQLMAPHPECFGPTIEPCKARLAYGLWGLPKILREISNKDDTIQYKALNTLIELLQNPLEYYRAVYDLKVVKKLEAALMWNLPESPESLSIIDKILINFEILAKHFDGAWRMVPQCDLMDALYDLIEKSTCTKDQPAKILQLMSSHPTVADVMLIHGHLWRVAKVLRSVDTVKDVYVHLAHLIERAPAGGMEAGFFDFLKCKIIINNNLQAIILKCFAFLLNTSEAHELFDKLDGIRVLYEMLKDDSLPEETLVSVAMAFKNSTINKIALWRCREFSDLPLILIRRAHSRTNDQLQLYSIQTLRQITVVPSIKDFVRKTCKKQIKSIECQKDTVRDAKVRLLEWLRRKRYINIEKRTDVDVQQEVKVSKDLLLETEDESCILSPSTSSSDNDGESEDNSIVKKRRQIAYRLDYGKVCEEKEIRKDHESQNVDAPLKTDPGIFQAPHIIVPPKTLTTPQRQPQTFYARIEEIIVNADPQILGVPAGRMPQEANITQEINTTTIIATRRVHDINRNSTIMPAVKKSSLPVDEIIKPITSKRDSSNLLPVPPPSMTDATKQIDPIIENAFSSLGPHDAFNKLPTAPYLVGGLKVSDSFIPKATTQTTYLPTLGFLSPEMKNMKMEANEYKAKKSPDKAPINAIPMHNQQMAAFVSSPPSSRVYIAVAHAPLVKPNNTLHSTRRAGVITTRSSKFQTTKQA